MNPVTVEREILLDCEKTSEDPPFIIKNATFSKDLTSPKQVRQMVKLDYSEIQNSCKILGTEQADSVEDRRFQEILAKSLHKNTDGNWEAPLPFKTDHVLLPDSKGHCLRRLLSLTL